MALLTILRPVHLDIARQWDGDIGTVRNMLTDCYGESVIFQSDMFLPLSPHARIQVRKGGRAHDSIRRHKAERHAFSLPSPNPTWPWEAPFRASSQIIRKLGPGLQ